MTRADKSGRLSARPLERISHEQALALLINGETAELMERADQIRRQFHGRNAYFVHSLNLNPTNICENRCDLCAFWREDNDSDAYMVTLDQARQILHRAKDLGITELHIVGGVTAKLGME